MADENQVQQEPQQLTLRTVERGKASESQGTTTEPQQEPQRVTTKNPNKVKAGKRLAEYNHRKREKESKEQSQQRSEPILWHWDCASCEGDRWPWLLHLSNQESPATTYSDDTHESATPSV